MKNIYKIGLATVFFLQPLISNSQSKKIPTKEGIEKYVLTNQEKIISELQNEIKDSLYYFDISTDNLEEYEDAKSNELGLYFRGGEIIITNEEKFIAYSKSDLKKWEIRQIEESNKFVRGTMIHELMHAYIEQLMIMNPSEIDKKYKYQKSFSLEQDFGASFIEEGICEYVALRMNEIISEKEITKPKNIEELVLEENAYNFKYKYAREYVGEFLKNHEIREGIKIILKNSPPTKEEILNPKLYYERLGSSYTKL